MRLTSRLLAQAQGRAPLPRTIDHLVLGGRNTLVGLAIAERLVKRWPGKETVVLSEEGSDLDTKKEGVVHAGIFSPPQSLATRFSIRGRKLLSSYCSTHSIPFSQTGQLIVSNKKDKRSILRLGELYMHTQHPRVSVPAWLLMGTELGEMEKQFADPECKVATCLYVPQAGRVVMGALEGSLLRSVVKGGGRMKEGRVLRVERKEEAEEGWVVRLAGGETEEMRAKHLILVDEGLASLVLPPLPGSDLVEVAPPRYLAYDGPGVDGVEKMIFPCPAEGMGVKIMGGPNLVVGLDGKVRFEVWGGMGVEEVVERVREFLPNVVASGFSEAPPASSTLPSATSSSHPSILHSLPSHPQLLSIRGFPPSSRATLASALAIGEGVERFLAHHAGEKTLDDGPEMVSKEEDDDTGWWARDGDGKEWWEAEGAGAGDGRGGKKWWKVW